MGPLQSKKKAWQRAATLTTAFLLGTGVLTATAVSDSLTAPAAHASVDDFEIESFDAEYELGRDETGRSSLKTTEHIVAVFPDFDQNRGLIRDIPSVYNGRSTNVTVLSVTDETGAERSFTTEPYGDFLSVIMAVPEGQFVHGAQHYVITYAQTDVTAFYEDTGVDEFYWDVNGTGWTQPFGRVTARITMSEDLREALSGNSFCYRGTFGAAEPCEIIEDNGTFFAQATDLQRAENITIAIGFEPGTFSPPPETMQEFLQRVPFLLWLAPLSFIAGIVVPIVAAVRAKRASRTGRAIIAQYDPPAGLPVALAAQVLRVPSKTMTATLLDWAVKRRIRLLYDEPQDLYGAQALNTSDIPALEATSFAALFGFRSAPERVEPGTAIWFEPKSTLLGDRAKALTSVAESEVKKRGIVRRGLGMRVIVWTCVLFTLTLALPVLHSVLTFNWTLMTILLAVGLNVLVWGLIFVVALLSLVSVRTRLGAELYEHLQGLREYIRLAEADRLRMLQSVEGVDVGSDRIVQVYELLLPYAVIFGFEDSWQAELSKYYRENAPEWISGSHEHALSQPLRLAAFSTFVASRPVTAPVRTSSSSSGWSSGSSFSSSSGGSSGGGFSGGGGGGGGGRGI